MDSLYRVEAASPELAGLLRRLKTIYAITGGKVEQGATGKADFNSKKSMLITQLHEFDNLLADRDALASDPTSRHYIKVRLQITNELRRLEDSIKDLTETHKLEVKKMGKKLTGEEITARKDVIESVVQEFQSKFKMAKGFSHAGAEENLGGGVGMRVLGKDQLMKGEFAGAGIKTKREEMSGEQLQKLEQINKVTQEQDSILEEMSKGLDELKDLAEKMNDELVLQDKMVSDLDKKTDRTQDKMDKVNDRMKDALAKINDKSSNFCVYIICLVLILGLASVGYNMAMKNKK